MAIVDADNDPNVESDLAVSRAQFGLPPCTTANGCFKKVSQTGSTGALPTNDSGWAGEIALDLDMVSAACPSCKILLVEAKSSSMADLGTAVNRAATMGAVAISNSSIPTPESRSTTPTAARRREHLLARHLRRRHQADQDLRRLRDHDLQLRLVPLHHHVGQPVRERGRLVLRPVLQLKI